MELKLRPDEAKESIYRSSSAANQMNKGFVILNVSGPQLIDANLTIKMEDGLTIGDVIKKVSVLICEICINIFLEI